MFSLQPITEAVATTNSACLVTQEDKEHMSRRIKQHLTKHINARWQKDKETRVCFLAVLLIF